MWLFGLAVREDFRRDSDIDLLVEYEDASRPEGATVRGRNDLASI